jgi:hypothetical protein
MALVTNEDLKRVTLAVQILLYSRVGFFLLLIWGTGGVVVTDGPVAKGIYLATAACVALFGILQGVLLNWMLNTEPLGMTPASIGGLFAGAGLQTLAGVCMGLVPLLGGGIGVIAYLVALVLLVCAVLANESQVPCLISELAWMVRDHGLEADARNQSGRARPSMAWMNIGCLPLLIIWFTALLGGILGDIIVLTFLAFTGGWTLWALVMAVYNSVLLRRLARQLDATPAEDVRHTKSPQASTEEL